MPDSSITKRALAQAMKELMTEHPLSKINISNIVERCNMNRKSFYYHFRDKYDLVNWIFYTEYVANFQDNDYASGWDILESICDFLYENRSFYCNALQIRGQNSFYDYFGETLSRIITIHLEGLFEDGKYRQFHVIFFTDAIRMSITRWLLEGSQIPPKEFVELMKSAVTGLAIKIVEDME